MILVDFECSDCGNKFEELIKSSDIKEIECSCGSVAQKIISAPRVGLYNDDERRHAVLKDRAHAHSKKTLRENQERNGITPKAEGRWNFNK